MTSKTDKNAPRRWKFGAMEAWIAAIILAAPAGWFFFGKVGDAALVWIGGAGYAITLVIVYFRLKYQEEQIDMQAKKEVNDRFHSAVSLLGNSETSARTGCIYSLYYLAIESEKYRKQVAQILCAHIRSKTAEKKYQEDHSERPSNEIQTAILLLFTDAYRLQGLYSRFSDVLLPADMSRSYLVGAFFASAKFPRVNFAEANIQRAIFLETDCEGGTFVNAQCQGAQFNGAHCQGANFLASHCEGAVFARAECQGVNFMGTHCQGTIFANANFEGAHTRVPQDKDDIFHPLSPRVGKDTELETMIVSGEIEEDLLVPVKGKDPFSSTGWQKHIQRIIEENKGRPAAYGCPTGIKVGVLEDTPEIRQIIKEIEQGEQTF